MTAPELETLREELAPELVGVPLEDLYRVLALADLADDVTLDEAKARTRCRQLARLAELQTERVFRNLGVIAPGSLLVLQAETLAAMGEQQPDEDVLVGLLEELLRAAGHNEFVVLVATGEQAVELRPGPADRPNWLAEAEARLERVIAHDDELGDLANATGDELRDALRLAAARLRPPLPPVPRPDPVMPEGPAPWNPPAEPYVPSMDLGGKS